MNSPAHLWHVPQLDNLELLSAHFTEQIFPLHTHPTYSIALIEDGVETIAFQKYTIQASAGSIVVLNPNQVHANQAGVSTGWRYRNCYLTIDHLRFACRSQGSTLLDEPWFPSPLIHRPFLFNQLLAAHRTLQEKPFTRAAERAFFGAVATLILQYSQFHPPLIEAAKTNKKLLALLAQINRNPALIHSVDELAEQSCLSRSQFVRQFSQLTGLAPATYILQKRIELAKTLLRQQYTPVEVALATGFFDQSHLTRHFKRLTGVTPSTLR